MKKGITLIFLIIMMGLSLPKISMANDASARLFLSFEDGDISNIVGGNDLKCKHGGAGESGFCLNYRYGDKPLTFRLQNALEKNMEYIFSVQTRVPAEENAENIRVVMQINTISNLGNAAYRRVELEGHAGVEGWAKSSLKLVWDGLVYDTTVNEMTESDESAGVTVSLIFEGNVSANTYFDVDEITVEPIVGEYDDGSNPNGVHYAVKADFEDGSTQGIAPFSAAELSVVGIEANSINVNESDNGSANALKIVFPGDTAYIDLPLVYMQANHAYDVSFKIARTDANANGSQIAIYSENSQRLDSENITPGVNYPTYQDYGPGLTAGQWTTYSMCFKYNVKTFDYKKYPLVLRLSNNNSSGEPIVMYVDYIIARDLGRIQNGDFETEEKIQYIYDSSEGCWSPKGIVNKVFGWMPENAESEIVNESKIYGNESEESACMRVTITADGGNVSQGINMENNTDYKFSFMARADNLGDGEELPMRLVMDRTSSGDNPIDVYNVLDYEYYGNDWTITNQWQRYEAEYHPNYSYAATPIDGVVPRLPFIYLEVNGNKAGTRYLIDDFVCEPLSSQATYDYPVISEVSVSGVSIEGQKVNIEFETFSPVNAECNGAEVRVMMSDNGTEWVAADVITTTENHAEWTVSKKTINKQIRFDIIPIDESGRVGHTVTRTLGRVQPIVKINPGTIHWDSVNHKVSTRLAIRSNIKNFAPINCLALFAVYDESGTMITHTETPIEIKKNANINLSASTVDENGTEGHMAALFLWDGTTVYDAGAEIINPAEFAYKE